MADGWHVTGTSPVYATDARGASVPVIRVEFVTDGGARAHVEVPFDGYTAAKAHELIVPLARELIATEQL